MAPAPAEVDVFSIPHSNIVEQLRELTDKLLETNFSNHVDWAAMLDKIRVTFRDFKIHEKIENECIMQKLKQRLRGLKIEIAAVTNVHSDNHLTDMLEMVDDGLKRNWDKTEVERNSFGRMLTKAIREFTKDFLPHLKEEEEVFQELLMQYFSYEELKDIKATVIERHSELHRKLKYLKDTDEKPTDSDDESEEDGGFQLLPSEIILKIFSRLSPKDLCRCAQVCSRWSKLAFVGTTWQTLYPCRWAKGMWDFSSTLDYDPVETSESDSSPANSGSEDELYVVVDEDADFDESGESDDSVSSTLSYEAMCIRKEAKMLTDMTKYLIPMIGPAVRNLVLSKSKGVTNGLVYKMIFSCPNLEYLDLRQTNISDVAFKGLGRNGAGSQLKHLDLSGCLKITDTTLIRLARSLGMNPPKVEMCCEDVCCLDMDTQNTADNGQSEVFLATRTFNNDEVAIENCDETLRKFSKWKMFSDETVGSECSNIAANDRDSWVDDQRTENCCLDADNDHVCFDHTRTCTSDWYSDSYNGVCCSYGDYNNRTSVPHVAAVDFDKNSSSKCCRTYSDNNNTRTEFCSGSGLCKQVGNSNQISRPMEFLGLSSCYQITDEGLRALAGNGGLPNLVHLDLSGCLNVTAAGLQELAEACPNLEHEQFFYCDNITEGPYQESASGCKNLQCKKRVCCRSGE